MAAADATATPVLWRVSAWIGVHLGRPVLTPLAGAVALFSAGYGAVKSLWLERGRPASAFALLRRATAEQVYWTALHPWRFFLIIGLVFGLLTLVLLDQFLRPLGFAARVPGIADHTLMVEVLPLVIAMILIARSGTAISTELGYMGVRRQVEALELMGVNRDFLIVLPRLLGGVLATVMIWTATSAAALIGGTLVARSLGLVGDATTVPAVLGAVQWPAVLAGLVKAALFGTIIPLSACVQGLRVGSSYTDIPKANAAAATRALVLCIAVNVVVSLL